MRRTPLQGAFCGTTRTVGRLALAALCGLMSACAAPPMPTAATLVGPPPLPWDQNVPEVAARVVHVETSASVEMRSGGITVSIQRNPWRIQIYGVDGRLLAEELAEPDSELTGTHYGTVAFEVGDHWYHALELMRIELTDYGARLSARTTDPQRRELIVEVRFLATGAVRLTAQPSEPSGVTRMGVAMVAGPDEHFFGFGEQFTSVDQRGRTVVIRPEDRVSAQVQGTYKPVPFFVSSHGYGLLVESFARPVMEMASVRDDAFATTVEEPALQLVVIDGPQPLTVLSRYADLTGHWPLPPRWAFGVWKNAIGGQDEVLAEARALRERRVPVTAIWSYDVSDDRLNLGWPWPHHLAVAPGEYPDPRAMSGQLHDLGYKVLGYLHPNLRNLSTRERSDVSVVVPRLFGASEFSFAAPDNLLIKHSDGSTYVNALGSASLDLSDPRAIDWWRGSVQSVLRDYDFDGWMQDFGEQAPEDGVYASGLPGTDEHNLYPVRYAQATYEAATAVKPDFVTFARSAYVGSTPYLRLTWPGDQSVDWSRSNGLPAQIPAMLSGAISGMPDYAPDVAGYYDPDAGPLSTEAEKELWMRWVELGALSPTFRDMLGARHTQNVNLWTDAETLEHFRTYAQLHNSLGPYIFSLAREASERGYPIMRHLFLEYPDDANTYALDDQYMLGDSLLVCPVVTPGARDRSCYLPAGEWLDYWTGQAYTGAGYVTLAAPVERIPLLIRAGSLLPTYPATVETLVPSGQPDTRTAGEDLALRVAPHPDALEHAAEFRLYDGTLLRYAATPAHATLDILGSPVGRSLSLELPSHGRLFAVTVLGALRRVEPIADRAPSDRGDWYDPASDTIHLHILIEAGTNATVSW